MAKTLEQLAKEIYNECLNEGEPITEQEALEMAKMELGAKEIKNYTQATVEKPKGTRKNAVDEVKVALIETIGNFLREKKSLENLTIKNPQREITFTFNGEEYSVTLTKHRGPKK